MLNKNEELFMIIFMTANEIAQWMNVTPKYNDVEIRESDYNRFKSYMRESLKYNDSYAIRYRDAMEKLFSTMKIEADPFFGNIYISTWNNYNSALTVLVELEQTLCI